MTDDFLESIRKEVKEELSKGLKYWETLHDRARPTGIKPLASQVQRIYEVVKNGSGQGILCLDVEGYENVEVCIHDLNAQILEEALDILWEQGGSKVSDILK